jgi:hypothetical protein
MGATNGTTGADGRAHFIRVFNAIRYHPFLLLLSRENIPTSPSTFKPIGALYSDTRVATSAHFLADFRSVRKHDTRRGLHQIHTTSAPLLERA